MRNTKEGGGTKWIYNAEREASFRVFRRKKKQGIIKISKAAGVKPEIFYEKWRIGHFDHSVLLLNFPSTLTYFFLYIS